MRNKIKKFYYILFVSDKPIKTFFTRQLMIQNEPEAALLRNARTGNQKAFAEIVRRYENLVYSFAFKVCRDREKASETLQDTFVNVYRKLGQFDHRSKFTTWLYSIVANNCLMKRRRSRIAKASVSFEEISLHPENGGRRSGSEITVTGWKDTPIDRVMNSELKNLLDGAVQKLPVDYRLVFILRDIEGRSAEETAKILKLSVPAVKSRLRRARIFLREQLNGYMAG